MLGLISSFSLVYNELEYIRFSKFRRIYTTNLEFEGHVLSSSNVLVFFIQLFFRCFALVWFFIFIFCCFEKFLKISVYKILFVYFPGEKFHRDVSQICFYPHKERNHGPRYFIDSIDIYQDHNICCKMYFQNVVLEKTLENPSDRKVIKPVNPRGNQS